MEAGTISISIGDGRHGSSIVLPRGHELVRHLEALLPAAINTAPKLAPPPPQYMYHQDAQTTDALNALATMSQRASLPVLPSLTRHLHNQSPTPVTYRPSSPYHSDSGSSSSSTPQNSTGSDPSSTTTGVKRRRAGKACASSGKKCQIPDCDKISVSRGLCRGHGGGRRCQFEGCTKGAQSRSDFCWSHGGGQRCEVPNCMRSRKTKRFCVAHLNWENATEGAALPTGEMTPRVLDAQQKVLMPRVIAPAVPDYVQTPASKLPSLQQALQKHQCAVPVVSTGFAQYAPLSC